MSQIGVVHVWFVVMTSLRCTGGLVRRYSRDGMVGEGFNLKEAVWSEVTEEI